jgi:hypothetical protein
MPHIEIMKFFSKSLVSTVLEGTYTNTNTHDKEIFYKYNSYPNKSAAFLQILQYGAPPSSRRLLRKDGLPISTKKTFYIFLTKLFVCLKVPVLYILWALSLQSLCNLNRYEGTQ